MIKCINQNLKKRKQRSAKSVSYYKMKVIKKDGREESFNRKKAYQSVYGSCLNAHHDKKISSNISEKVIRDLVRHLKGKKIVNSHDIFKYISTLLEKYDEDSAFLYHTHKDIS